MGVARSLFVLLYCHLHMSVPLIIFPVVHWKTFRALRLHNNQVQDVAYDHACKEANGHHVSTGTENGKWYLHFSWLFYFTLFSPLSIYNCYSLFWSLLLVAHLSHGIEENVHSTRQMSLVDYSRSQLIFDGRSFNLFYFVLFKVTYCLMLLYFQVRF